MRLTANVINSSPCFINPIKDRELDLKGLKAPQVENLGVTKDLNDTIDLSDNEIKHLTNFPHLKRLKNLILNNNRIQYITPNLNDALPQLTSLILTNNQLLKLIDLEPLAKFTKLNFLVLLKNPVQKDKNYRLWCIHRFPKVQILDFQRVLDKERQEARDLFLTEAGEHTSLAHSILNESASNTFESGEGLPSTLDGNGGGIDDQLSTEEQKRIQESIQAASKFI
ncbi:L domain-like protein [Conidiobolus coronatus NRRL 28638]|uniref:U2 small nuclear ribonucleoprotein A' n=1 Tax=Conidiobolus coronatus (strain ATCC 28846 / CBS 209.66 / NRRL 28638) TaxID=796925 RepID=A0A137PAZ3_CONC2|nr:L domain-like protein [Conidiobolus coronatus NRRL 28638]|eukprot:KXN72165.1 L domain-like protein [Conidiobolus coronatus NRRL 28638]